MADDDRRTNRGQRKKLTLSPLLTGQLIMSCVCEKIILKNSFKNFSRTVVLNKMVLGHGITHLSPGSFGPVVKEMSIKTFLFLALVAICSAEQKILCNFSRGH